MITSLDLSGAALLDVGLGVLEFSPPETVTITSSDGARSSVVVPGLQEGGWLEVWCGEDWCCFVGLQSSSLLVAQPGGGRVVVAVELDRLEMGDHYDPGGLGFVEFHPIFGADVLVVYEHGVARIGRDGLVWHRVHFDLSARVVEVTAEVVWFCAEADDRFGFRLSDGADLFTSIT